MNLSIALAVFNEERLIRDCLNSVYDWTDEIVIVDGGSTDKTVEIIKEADKKKKVKLIQTDNPPMFHINKQKAIEACTGDWILQLDADEIVSDDLRKEISEIINHKQIPNFKSQSSNGQELVAYWIPRLNYFLGQPLTKGGQYPDYTIRFYRNGSAHLPCKSLHEQVEVTGTTGHLKSNLLHYPYKDFSHYLHKWVGYSMEEGENDYKKGVRPGLMNLWLYVKVKPTLWFLKTYFRHRGYVDGFAGFVFSLFSGLRFIPAYIRIVELSRGKR